MVVVTPDITNATKRLTTRLKANSEGVLPPLAELVHTAVEPEPDATMVSPSSGPIIDIYQAKRNAEKADNPRAELEALSNVIKRILKAAKPEIVNGVPTLSWRSIGINRLVKVYNTEQGIKFDLGSFYQAIAGNSLFFLDFLQYLGTNLYYTYYFFLIL